MEKKEIIENLEMLINRIEILKAESGPKANDFIKWVREVKQFIEKSFGADHSQLRAFKKIDYYPKHFDILSSEASFKKAWTEGLMIAKNILEDLKDEAKGVPKADTKMEIPAKEKEAETPKPEKEKVEEPVAAAPVPVVAAAVAQIQADPAPVAAAAKPAPAPAPVVEALIPAKPAPVVEALIPSKEKKEEKTVEKKNASLNLKGRKVLLISIDDGKLNEHIFTFVKKMGYEPVVVDYNTEGDAFITDTLAYSVEGDPVFAIINWKGEIDCEGKKTPRPCVIFSTGFYVSKLTNKRVLIISRDDIDFYDENYGGLNFLEIDDIKELMELKLAREMDSAGLNIDFNFLKKK
ncbi:MAG: nucleotide-binding protein [Endomicrobium sp.]|jgi:predicted nucleotide-binding protein|nr:nucleotide-binding protein [Endomicrobium sp.]